MPELPEVETIRMGLEKHLVGHRIESVEVRLSKIVTGNTKNVIGATVKGVRRFGKALVIDLDPSTNSGQAFSIAAHIKLTGQFILQAPNLPNKLTGGELPNKWTYVTLHLDRGGTLFYNDVRQFGWVRIIPTSEVENLPFISKLGPEPFGKLTLGLFKKILQDR